MQKNSLNTECNLLFDAKSASIGKNMAMTQYLKDVGESVADLWGNMTDRKKPAKTIFAVVESGKAVNNMGFAIAYSPCGWCPYKESGERCGMCELAFRRKEWISVEERLPDDNSRCLAWSAYYNDWMARFSVYERKTNKWYVVCGGRLKNTAEDSVKVTHWMPLPEPPEMKGE